MWTPAREMRVFSFEESIPSQDFQDHLSVSEDGTQDGAEPEPDEVV